MFAGLTVAENVALPLRYHREAAQSETEIQERVGAIIQMTGLEEWAGHTARNLGASWHPRVGLARALALAPEVLLLDEPLAGLEVRHRRWWLGFLDALAAGHALMRGRALTLITTTTDFGEWLEHGRQFAEVRGQSWRALEGRDQAGESDRLRAATGSAGGEPPAPAPAIQSP
jgi:ABC-type sulfate/molybdate transport systems ATPase subunit